MSHMVQCFYLHHCNLDRIYEAYLKCHPDSQQEFAATQQRLNKESNEADRFSEPLKPFIRNELMLPSSTIIAEGAEGGGGGGGEEIYMTAKDTFDTRALGYVYDELPVRRPPQMRTAPTYVMFKDIDPASLSNKSYQIHVFILTLEASATSAGLNAFRDKVLRNDEKNLSNISSWSGMTEYAGNCGVFGGKTKESCANCSKSGPIYVKLEVTATLQKLGLTRHQAQPFCVCVDEVIFICFFQFTFSTLFLCPLLIEVCYHYICLQLCLSVTQFV
jgi:hypothetical protein